MPRDPMKKEIGERIREMREKRKFINGLSKEQRKDPDIVKEDRELSKQEKKFSEMIQQMSEEEASYFLHDFEIHARDSQWIDWENVNENIVLYSAGRGAGKSYSFAGNLKMAVERHGASTGMIIAMTAKDLRRTIIPAVMGHYSPYDKNKPEYVASKASLYYPNGAVINLVSSEAGSDSIRGANNHIVIMDEAFFCYENYEFFIQAQMTLRAGISKMLLTSTPIACPLAIELYGRAEQGDGVKLITGKTTDNAVNLSDTFMDAVVKRFSGTSLAKQELEGQLILSNAGAMWQPETLDNNRVHAWEVPEIEAYAIGVDPALSNNKQSDLTGLVVVGKGVDGILYVVADHSARHSAAGWVDAVHALYDQYSAKADTVCVVESNALGNQTTVVLTRDYPRLPIKTVHSHTSKKARIMPTALSYERGEVKHVKESNLADLEAEQISWNPDSTRKSPDRIDALQMACSHLVPAKKSFTISRELLI